MQVFQLDGEEVLSFVLEKTEEFVEVAHVGIDSVGRYTFLELQILIVATHEALSFFLFHGAKVGKSEEL